MDNLETRSHIFPNLFYDVIVFLTPTLTLLLGLGEGLGFLDDAWGSLAKGQNSTLSVLIFSLIVFFLGYEYGRLAETFSDFVVALPLRILRRLGLVSKDGDFGRSLAYQVSLLGVEQTMFEGRCANKWSLYFYAIQNAPLIGADLLKRYAWEKLARSAGFSFLMLAVSSLSVILFNRINNAQHLTQPAELGTWPYLATTLTLYLLCVIDYYKRNSWNCDLLITTIPIVVHETRQRHARSVDLSSAAPVPPVVAAAMTAPAEPPPVRGKGSRQQG